MSFRFVNLSKFAAAVFLLIGTHAFAETVVGFSRGNDLNMMDLKGQIRLGSPCRYKSPKSFEIIHCESNALHEGNEDFFVGPVNEEASEVVLTAKSSGGESQTKKISYDGKNGRTSRKVNLWYSTLLQTPLLKEGAHEIEYKLKNDAGKTLESGRFNVTVTKEAQRTCSEAKVHSLTSFECNMKNSVCKEYFKDNNFCQ